MILCRPNCPGIFMPDPAHSIIVAPGGVKVCPVLTRSGAHGREILAFVHPTAGHQIVKGTLEEGEALEPAALRELAEESGIDSARIMAKIAEIEVPDYCQFWHVYECETDADLAEKWSFFAQEDEGKWFHFFWIPLAQLPTKDWIDQFQPVISALQDWFAAKD